MADRPNNGRTHEPSLREITAELDGLRELLLAKLVAVREVIDERDRRYTSLFEEAKDAMRSALAAQKELTDSSFKSSEKAIIKAEDAQREYNLRSNEFRGQLEDQANRLMPKEEANTRLSVVDDKIEDVKKDIASLRESRGEVGGRSYQTQSARETINTVLAALALLVSGGLGLIVALQAMRGTP